MADTFIPRPKTNEPELTLDEQQKKTAEAKAAQLEAEKKTAEILASNDELKVRVAGEKKAIEEDLVNFKANAEKTKAVLVAESNELTARNDVLKKEIAANKEAIEVQQSVIKKNETTISQQNDHITTGTNLMTNMDANLEAKGRELKVVNENIAVARRTEQVLLDSNDKTRKELEKAQAELIATREESKGLIAKQIQLSDREKDLNDRETYLKNKYQVAGVPW